MNPGRHSFWMKVANVKKAGGNCRHQDKEEPGEMFPVSDAHGSPLVRWVSTSVRGVCLVMLFRRPTAFQKVRLCFHDIAEKSLGIDALGRIVWTGVDTARDG